MSEKAPRISQRSLLAVVMFVILLVSVGLAWWLVHQRTIPLKSGANILAEIRSKSLPHYWGDKTEFQCYIMRDRDGANVAWRIDLRERTKTGYQGLRMFHSGANLLEETWQLTDDAHHGRYNGPTPDVRVTTDIILAGAKITVVQQLRGGASVKDSVPTPDNYIPEGMEPLVAAQVLRTKEQAVFKTLLNDEAIVASQVNFGTEKMTAIDSNSVRTETAGLGPARKQIYYFGADGRLEKIVQEENNATLTAVAPDDLLAAFPNDWKLAQVIAEWQHSSRSQPTTETSGE